LGQFDIFAPEPVAPHGRLLLVAPNIAHAETELGVDPKDFRLWVCLHEETHRVQFTAHPWLRGYLREQAQVVTELTDMSAPGWEDLARLVTGRTGRGERPVSLLDLLPDTVDVRSTLAQVTAVMSLLEGHADVVMDRVGPRVITSVARIRARFERRRDGRSGMDRLVRRVLGMDVKLAQYRDGAKFCRAVIGAAGIDGLNRAFTAREALPELAEIHEPRRWLERMGLYLERMGL
ncbi:MAG: zinc-dependent metalloprotease, partial [Propionibacteriaceae bacterium]|nr:zinc-dependent metalloprotease [Propionibacteriaceae bacterium]